MPRPVRLHDTLSGEVRPLEPRDPGKVAIYACGPTVYARIHVGNARPYVVYSLLKRFLEAEGYETTLVVNVTDVNDKIYDAARGRGVTSEQLAQEMTERYREDTDSLGLGRPDHEPLASETIGEIVELIAALVGRGHAYESGGDVYFRVESFSGYGRLSNRALEDMDQGEDAGEASLKERPYDFALWKARKPGEDTWWPSPWGDGRPGWHIECSAMAEKLLGLDFDVHGGGSDLIFPHHENELAQTEAGRGRPLARLWVHNGMVQSGGEKMAKSVGNVWALHAAVEEYGAAAVVAFLASAHYRQPLRFSREDLGRARSEVERLRELCRRLDRGAPEPAGLAAYAERFRAALADDFNTPTARAALFEWVGEANRRLDAGERLGVGPLRDMLGMLGLERVLDDVEDAVPGDVERLVGEREQARAARDFARADAIRDELAAAGWEIRDTPDGPRAVRRP